MLTATTGGFDTFAAALRRTADVVAEKRRLENAAGEYYVQKVAPQTFAGGGANIGESWAPNLAGTQTLVQSGALRDSIGHQPGGIGEQIGSPLIYALAHQQEHAGTGFDGVIVAKNVPYLKFKVAGRWVSKARIRMVKRVFLKFTDDILGNIVDQAFPPILDAAMRG